jgi:hypothetical protein
VFTNHVKDLAAISQLNPRRLTLGRNGDPQRLHQRLPPFFEILTSRTKDLGAFIVTVYDLLDCLSGASRLVVIGRGPTPVKILFRLRLQKFVPGVVPQPLVRVEYRVLTFQYIFKILKKMTTRMPEHFFKNFDVKCSKLF